MAYVDMAYRVMAYIVMAYKVVASSRMLARRSAVLLVCVEICRDAASDGVAPLLAYSYGLCSYGQRWGPTLGSH